MSTNHEKRALWVAHRVETLFYGRKGHGGGPCTRRVLSPKQLTRILEQAYDDGYNSAAKRKTKP
jgi:hypothetical protein